MPQSTSTSQSERAKAHLICKIYTKVKYVIKYKFDSVCSPFIPLLLD
jgi:hypothetical protein